MLPAHTAQGRKRLITFVVIQKEPGSLGNPQVAFQLELVVVLRYCTRRTRCRRTPHKVGESAPFSSPAGEHPARGAISKFSTVSGPCDPSETQGQS